METSNYFSGWVPPSLQRSPLLWHAQSTRWHRLGSISASAAFLCLFEVRQGTLFAFGEQRSVLCFFPLWLAQSVLTHLGRVLGLQRVAVVSWPPRVGQSLPCPLAPAPCAHFPSAAEGHCACDSQIKSLHPHKPLASG